MHIVFKIFPAHSHLNATFRFASLLKSKNYHVTYAGLKDFRSEVLMQGFDYFIDNDVLPQLVPNARKFSFFEKIKSKKLYKKFHQEYAKGTGFDNIIQMLNPDIIVVDSPYVRHAIPLSKKGIPFVIFESMVALNKTALHPPLSSTIIPNSTLFNKTLVEISWKKHFIKSFLERLFFGELYPSKSTIKKMCNTFDFPFNEIDFNRYFHIGLNNVPEIIASPKDFDFPYCKKENQYYLGLSVHDNRNEVAYDFKYISVKNEIGKILINNKTRNPEDKINLIYCSFGSMPWRYEGVEKFYKKLTAAYKNYEKVQIFISVGYDFSYHSIKNVSKNIHVFKKVPQLELLKQMDLMITHGGMNTITECILSEVPMLVYPGNNKIDQVGNASRVAFHKIGLMGDLKRDSLKVIKAKVNKLLTDVSYKENIREMKNKIIINENSDEALNLIDTILAQGVKGKHQIH